MSKKVPVLLALVVVALLAVGCGGNYKETSRTFELFPAAGRRTRILLVSSDEYLLEKRAKEISRELSEVINGGEYNVLYVKTLYSNEHLTSAEIGYDVSSPGRGNGLRVLLINSNKFSNNKRLSWEHQDKEVRAELHKVVNSGTYYIARVHTIYLKGYLIAAEVYYWDGWDNGGPLAA